MEEKLSNAQNRMTITGGAMMETAMPDLWYWGFVLSLVSMVVWVIAPASLLLSGIGATYHRTKRTDVGIIISLLVLCWLTCLSVLVWFVVGFGTGYDCY